MRVKLLLIVALAACGVLALSSPSAIVGPGPPPSGDPVRFWSVSKIEQGAGELEVDHGAQVGGVLKVDDLGPVAFNFRGTPLFDRAEEDLFSSADGKHFAVGVAAPLLNLGFGDFGIADTDLSGGDDFGDDLVLDPQGDIVVVGTATSPTVTDMALLRYRPDGTLDTSLTTDFHGLGDFGHALAIDPRDHAVVAAGTTANGSADGFGLMRANL